MGKETITKIQDAQSPRQNAQGGTVRHLVIKLTKVKDEEKNLKAIRENQQIRYKGIPQGYPLLYQEKLCRSERKEIINLHWSMRGKVTAEYSTQESSFLD